MTSIQASVAELENLDSDVKGKGTRWKHLGRNTNALPKDGLVRSSNEVSVMEMERRDKQECGMDWSTRWEHFGGTGMKRTS